MRSLIDQYEIIAQQVAKEIKALVDATRDELGDRPYGQSRMNETQEVEAYNALRASEGGLYGYAEGIRTELERRLQGVDIDTRLSKNLGPENIRWIAYTLTFKYAARMKRLSDKLGIPLVEREVLPEPLPMPEETGIVEWPDLMTSSMESGALSPMPFPVETPPVDLSFPPPPPPLAEPLLTPTTFSESIPAPI